MKEYIEREATKTEIAIYLDTLIYEKPEGIESNLDNIKLALLDLIDYNTVAADVSSVRHGEWIAITNGLQGWKCNLCDEHIYVEPPRNVDRYLYPYCPGCGAKMNGGSK